MDGRRLRRSERRFGHPVVQRAKVAKSAKSAKGAKKKVRGNVESRMRRLRRYEISRLAPLTCLLGVLAILVQSSDRSTDRIGARMHNPPHPGEILRELCLEPLGLSVTGAAKALGVSRKSLSQLLNGRAGVSAEMAVRLSLAFGTTPESWLNHQTHFALWKLQSRRKKLKVRRLAA